METLGFYSSSNDQKIFPSKSQFAKTQKKKLDMNYQYSFISRPSSDNFYQAPLRHTTAGGLILQPRLPPHDHIYPPFSLPQQQYQEQQQKQPPLLPLPLPHTRIQNPDPHPHPHPHPHPRVNRSLSCQPTNRKNRNDSLTTTPRKYSKPQPLPTIAKILKPTAKDIEQQVRKMYNSSISGSSTTSTDSDIKRRTMKDAKEEKVVDDFSGSVAPFRLSPPPSSLPLPTFSLRPKHMMRSCNVEASGFDAGATDKLQRLLRLN